MSQDPRPEDRPKWLGPEAKYADIADLPEDARIDQIGRAAMAGQVVSFVTDADDGKLDRYLLKIFAKFPLLELVERGTGPVENTVWAKVKRSNRRNSNG